MLALAEVATAPVSGTSRDWVDVERLSGIALGCGFRDGEQDGSAKRTGRVATADYEVSSKWRWMRLTCWRHDRIRVVRRLAIAAHGDA